MTMGDDMDSLEIEVKFYIDDPEALRKRILSLGAVGKGRFFERNFCFENEAGGLKKAGSLLRLRKDARNTLTFKEKPPVENDQFKVYRELEVTVGDFDDMKRILEALGFHRDRVYEKWRETFVLDGVVLCMDSLPFGDFLEIEGQGEAIRELAAKLGMMWSNRILKNYLALFEKVKRTSGLAFQDVTFENFRNVQVDFTASM